MSSSFRLRCNPNASDLNLVRLYIPGNELPCASKPSTHLSYRFMFMARQALKFFSTVLSQRLCATCYIAGAQDSRYSIIFFCDRYGKYLYISLPTVLPL